MSRVAGASGGKSNGVLITRFKNAGESRNSETDVDSDRVSREQILIDN